MTVARLREEMSNHEFVQWTRYFAVKQQQRELEILKAKGGG
jgi:hypothetical protein